MTFHLFVEPAAVEQTGQRVVVRHVHELRFESLALADVSDSTFEPHNRAGGVTPETR